MLYVSTSGKTDLMSSAHAITRGLADDGGLFVPQRIPSMRMGDIKAMAKKPYTERAIDNSLKSGRINGYNWSAVNFNVF